jgi:hypothetical protein
MFPIDSEYVTEFTDHPFLDELIAGTMTMIKLYEKAKNKSGTLS